MRAITVILTAIIMTGCSALYNVSEVRPVVGVCWDPALRMYLSEEALLPHFQDFRMP